MDSIQAVAVTVGFISGLIGLGLYLYRFSKYFSKLDNIPIIEEKLDQIKESLVQDMVSISVLTQRVDKLEEDLKCTKK